MQLSAYRAGGQGPGAGEGARLRRGGFTEISGPKGRSFPRPPAPDSKIPSAACIFADFWRKSRMVVCNSCAKPLRLSYASVVVIAGRG